MARQASTNRCFTSFLPWRPATSRRRSDGAHYITAYWTIARSRSSFYRMPLAQCGAGGAAIATPSPIAPEERIVMSYDKRTTSTMNRNRTTRALAAAACAVLMLVVAPSTTARVIGEDGRRAVSEE